MRVLCFLFSLILGLTARVGMIGKGTPADTFEPDTFPIIRAAAKQTDAVRVASFNLRCTDVNGVPMKDRTAIVLKQICDIAPDSIGLQEVTEAWLKEVKKLPGYAVAGEARDGDGKGEGNQILYNKLRYTCLDSGTFWLSETPDEPSYGWDAACRRVCTYVFLQNRLTGDVYAHVNSHFDHMGKEAVVKEARMVADFIRSEYSGVPVVFTADLNSRPDSEPYAIMTERLLDTRLTAKDAQMFGTFHAVHPGTHAEHYIDYVLCSPDTEVLTYRTVTAGECGRFVSDHFPIYADVRFPDAPTCTYSAGK